MEITAATRNAVEEPRVKERPEVTVIIPALNEASTVGEVIRECAPHADQILVVDGFSEDGTAEVAEQD